MRESRSPERAHQISLRMSIDDHRRIKELAQQHGVAVTSYLLGKALDRPFEPTRRSGPTQSADSLLPLDDQEFRKAG